MTTERKPSASPGVAGARSIPAGNAESIDYDELRRYAVRPSHARRGVPPRARTTWLEKLLDRAYLALRRFRTRAGR